jgi:hypothetical protein
MLLDSLMHLMVFSLARSRSLAAFKLGKYVKTHLAEVEPRAIPLSTTFLCSLDASPPWNPPTHLSVSFHETTLPLIISYERKQ